LVGPTLVVLRLYFLSQLSIATPGLGASNMAANDGEESQFGKDKYKLDLAVLAGDDTMPAISRV